LFLIFATETQIYTEIDGMIFFENERLQFFGNGRPAIHFNLFGFFLLPTIVFAWRNEVAIYSADTSKSIFTAIGFRN